TLGIEKAHFIGNSMGGGQLARAAEMDPPAFPIVKMILGGAGGVAPRNESRETLNSYDGSREHMCRCVETLVQRQDIRSDESYIDRRHEIALEPGAWECTAAARFKMPNREPSGRVETDFGKIKFPTLIIAGAKDPLRNPGYADELQKEIESSELVTFADAGHCPQIDVPDAFNKAVIDFLSR
ncbi:MAG: alpha/beta fold hydrolase, partial [Alphaproteobacteria bacterium]